MCAFESCDKPCYIEYFGRTRRIHDYCCKQHAMKHRERIETVWPGSYQSLRGIHHEYSSLDYDQFQQHHHQGGHSHYGNRLHSQTGENIISLHRCVYTIMVYDCMSGIFLLLANFHWSLAVTKIIWDICTVTYCIHLSPFASFSVA